MRVDELDYDLPPDRIAQVPAARREDARLLVLRRSEGRLEDRCVGDLPTLLAPQDLVVLNDTRVLAARLHARRATGGRVEVLLVEETPGAGGEWLAWVRAGGHVVAGERLDLGDGTFLVLRVPLGRGRWLVAGSGEDVSRIMDAHGRMPLPPYVRRGDDDPRDALDRERYQTVYAREAGAIAAPTAGLHLTDALLRRLAEAGVGVTRLTLHVGPGTFESVHAERFEDHAMHRERFRIPEETAERIRTCRGRVVAVGTTTVRALEAAAARDPDGLVRGVAGTTRLLIQPGHRFRVVDALFTNFHLPRSTLLALVAAFAGQERILDAYREAVRRGYRFFSYGDAMLIL